MANIIKRMQYRCSDDCVMSGCPGHEAVLEWQSVSDAYTFTVQGDKRIDFERGQLDAFLTLLRGLDRVDAAGAGLWAHPVQPLA